MPAPIPPSDPQPRRARMRALLLRLVLFVAALHVVAVALYHALGVESASPRARSVFVVAWTVATLVLVSRYLRRIRLLRRGYDVK